MVILSKQSSQLRHIFRNWPHQFRSQLVILRSSSYGPWLIALKISGNMPFCGSLLLKTHPRQGMTWSVNEKWVKHRICCVLLNSNIPNFNWCIQYFNLKLQNPYNTNQINSTIYCIKKLFNRAKSPRILHIFYIWYYTSKVQRVIPEGTDLGWSRLVSQGCFDVPDSPLLDG